MLHQGNPLQVAEQTLRGEVDVGIATEALATFPDLVTLPCYEWNRCVLVPRGHPLAKVSTADAGGARALPDRHLRFRLHRPLADQRRIRRRRASRPNVVLTALDADVIKTYVELGMGVGIVAQMAYDPARDAGLDEARRRAPVRADHDAARAAPRRVPARLRLRVHRAASRRSARPRGRRRRARRQAAAASV